MLEKESADAYWRAYEEWKRLPRDLGGPIDASKRLPATKRMNGVDFDVIIAGGGVIGASIAWRLARNQPPRPAAGCRDNRR